MAIQIGILSFAHLHAEGYQANLKRIGDVDLVGFSHGNPDEGRYFAEKYGLRWFPEHHELLAEGLDGVLICAENAHHLELIEKAAAAKCEIAKRAAFGILTAPMRHLLASRLTSLRALAAA